MDSPSILISLAAGSSVTKAPGPTGKGYQVDVPAQTALSLLARYIYLLYPKHHRFQDYSDPTTPSKPQHHLQKASAFPLRLSPKRVMLTQVLFFFRSDLLFSFGSSPVVNLRTNGRILVLGNRLSRPQLWHI